MIWQLNRKRKRVNGRLRKVQLSEKMIVKAMRSVKQEILNETLKNKEIEVKEKQSKLLDELLHKKSKEKK